MAAFPAPGRGHRRTPWWNSALEQGRAAARALLEGDDAPALTPAPYFWTEQFGSTVRISGELPARGATTVVEGTSPGAGMILTWTDGHGGGTAATVNKRIPIARLRALTRSVHAPMEVRR